MKKTKWFSGPPPSIGWWPASVCGNIGALRWWNGAYWSHALFKNDLRKTVTNLAQYKDPDQHIIRWTHRPANWPARSRT